jgi:alcohol dehydrogenase
MSQAHNSINSVELFVAEEQSERTKKMSQVRHRSLSKDFFDPPVSESSASSSTLDVRLKAIWAQNIETSQKISQCESVLKESGKVFRSVPNVVCCTGARRSVGRIMEELLSRHEADEQADRQAAARGVICVVTDSVLCSLGLVDDVVSSIEATGRSAFVFDGVVEDPPEHVVLELKRAIASNSCVGVVGVGGGSSLDAAKLGAYLGHPNCMQELVDCYGIGKLVGKRLPLIQVPTTAGTGSESTAVAVVTTGESEKQAMVSDVLYCDAALLDAELTLSLPPKITAMTGIDAMVHALEAFTSASPFHNPLSDLLALEALKLLAGNLKAAVSPQGASNLEARSAMLLGSCYAGMAFSNSPVGGVHALAYPIGSHFHVAHGLSNSLVLPHVLRFNGVEKYAALKPILFPHQREDEDVADGFAKLAVELGLPRCLREVGISERDLALLAADAMKQTRILSNNPRPITLSDAIEIYRAALDE